MSWVRELLFKLKEMKPIFPRLTYYSFVIAYISVMTVTLMYMFMSKNGCVNVCEPLLFIRIPEIIMGIGLVAYSFKLIRHDSKEFIEDYWRRYYEAR